MGRLFNRSQRTYAICRKKKEKRWENERTFKRSSRRWESPAQLRAMTYAEYLKSKYWRDTRLDFLRAASFRCQRCKAKDVELHVHHKSYEHRGCEWLYPNDVIVLCKGCHGAEHGKD